MQRRFASVAIAAALAAAFWGCDLVGRPRLTKERKQEMIEASRKLEEARQKEQEAMAEAAAKAAEEAKAEEDAEAAETPETAEAVEAWPDKAPDVFKVRFETTKGAFVMEVEKDLAPIGVEHFYDLVRKEFYDGAGFFRVVPGFVVQFGLPADPAMLAKYGEKTLKDEPPKASNAAGTVTYAKSQAPNSRSSQLFINLGDNAQLDGMGFAPFAEVVDGMDVVRAITAEYGERPNQMQIRMQGNAYLKQSFPGLDYIETARLVK